MAGTSLKARAADSNQMIAASQHKTASHVEQMLLLATANHDVHKLVRDGKVAAYVAIEAVREYGEKAGEFLQGKLEEAQSRGKATVTGSAIRGWTPPRKLVTTVMGSVEAVVSTLDNSTRRQLAELEALHAGDPAQLAGRKIEVDAAALLELVKAHGVVTEARTARESADAAAKAAAGQQSLEVGGADGA
jgi:hypothetical protein